MTILSFRLLLRSHSHTQGMNTRQTGKSDESAVWKHHMFVTADEYCSVFPFISTVLKRAICIIIANRALWSEKGNDTAARVYVRWAGLIATPLYISHVILLMIMKKGKYDQTIVSCTWLASNCNAYYIKYIRSGNDT